MNVEKLKNVETVFPQNGSSGKLLKIEISPGLYELNFQSSDNVRYVQFPIETMVSCYFSCGTIEEYRGFNVKFDGFKYNIEFKDNDEPSKRDLYLNGTKCKLSSVCLEVSPWNL